MSFGTMSISPERSLVIIGGGWAGAAVAVQAIANAREPLDITIVEPAARLGRGIAYATADPDHVVNGLAGAFALDAARPDRFLEWLAGQVAAGAWVPPAGTPLAASSPPRALYGAYVEHELSEAVSHAAGRVRLHHLRDRAVDIDGTSVILASGRSVTAHHTVLATGLYRREPALGAGLAGHPAYVLNIFKPAAFEPVARASRIVILGSGLSMLDALIAAEKRGFRGNYIVISRRGLLVAPRRNAPSWPGVRDPTGFRTARDVLRWIQQERRAVRTAGEDWQQLPALFRQHTSAIWAGLDDGERRRLLARLVPFWNLSQHRAAPASYAWLERVRAQDRLQALAGTVTKLEPAGAGIRATIRSRDAGTASSLEADLVLSALGYEFDWTRIDDPLVRNLLARGRVVPHAVGLGIRGEPQSLAVIDADGKPSLTLFAIGHPLRGELWESSSLREQLDQAMRLGATLARALAQLAGEPADPRRLIPAA